MTHLPQHTTEPCRRKSTRRQMTPALLLRLQAELEDQVQISSSFEDLCDQNVIVYLLRVKAKEYMPHVRAPHAAAPALPSSPSPILLTLA